MAKKKATVRIKGVPEARDSLLKFIAKAVQGDDLLLMTGKTAADQVRKRTRAKLDGEPPDGYKQKDLSPVTIEVRKLWKKHYQVNEFALPERSNLTLTGQLLESISFRIVKSISEVVLFLKPERKDRPFDKKLAREEYENLLDKDHNATNSKAKGKNKAKASAAGLLLRQKQKSKTNVQIKDELEAKGRRFFFISTKLIALLENKIAKELGRQLSIYSRIRRKLGK